MKKTDSIQEGANIHIHKSDELSPQNSYSKKVVPKPVERFVEIGLILSILFFLFSTIIGFFVPLQEIIINLLLSINSNITLGWAYLGFAFILTSLIYFNVFYYGFFKGIFIGIEKSMEDFSSSLPKQAWFLLLPLLVIGFDIIFLSGSVGPGEQISFLFEDTWDSRNETQEGISGTWSHFMCMLDIDCIQRRQNQDQNVQAESVSYDIRLGRSIPSRTQEWISNNKLPIPYSIQTGEGELYLEKVECYLSTPRQDNLLDTVEFDQRRIVQKEMATVGGISCDISEISLDETQEITITPVLYYTIPIEYYQEIPLVDLTKFAGEQGIELNEETQPEIEQKAREEFSTPSPVNSASQALDITRFTSPNFPVLLHSLPYHTTDYVLEFTFQRESSSLGTLQETSLTNLEYSSNYIEIDGPEIPQEIEAFDGVTSLPMSLKILNNQLPQNEPTFITTPINMEFEASMKKQDRSITFTIIVPQNQSS